MIIEACKEEECTVSKHCAEIIGIGRFDRFIGCYDQ
jgi:hypothetical protein